MRILLAAALAASLAAGTLSAAAQTAPAPTPAKQKCKSNKDETSCGAQTGCAWSKPGDAKGKCKTAPKPKTT